MLEFKPQFHADRDTLGEKPWVYLDGYKIISYLHKHLK